MMNKLEVGRTNDADLRLLTLFNIFCVFSLIRKTYFCYKELKNTLNNVKILNHGKDSDIVVISSEELEKCIQLPET